jgi:phospholipid-binding lipoprotein MlaA
VRQGVSNIASNLGEPSNVINNVMQGRISNAAHNTVRFIANSTIGLAGTFDVATAIGLEERDTDFGETMHVWGAQEGAYVELPLLGPSTSRDAVGTAVDFVLNPIETMFHDDVRKVQTATNVGSRLGDRHDFSNTVDSILYESEDSYAQTRLTYLQNRRFKLGGGEAEESYFDPYEDPYDQ